MVNQQATQILKKIPENNFDFDQILSGKKAGMLTVGEWQISSLGLVSRNLYTSRKFDLSDDSLNLDEYISQALLFDAKTVAFSQAGYSYRQHPQARTKTPTPIRFAILHSDKLRENLVISHFGEHSKEVRKAKTASMQHLMGRYVLFFRFKKHFSNIEQERINTLFTKAFSNLSTTEIWHSHLNILKKCFLTLPRFAIVLGCRFYAFLKKRHP
jgi:hypothetical protein